MAFVLNVKNRYYKLTMYARAGMDNYNYFFMIDIKSVPFNWLVSCELSIHIVICSFSLTLVHDNVRQCRST